MKKTNEHLLRDLLTTGDLVETRNRSLEGMLLLARSRRRRRHATWACLCAALPGLWFAAHLLTRSPHAPVATANSAPPALVVAPSTAPSEEAEKLRLITTEELLALFPDRPLALIGPPGEQTLVFLDEAGILLP